MTQKKRVTRRIVNTKRHTTHYVIGGQTVSVIEARRLALKGLVAGVRVVGNHIQASIGARRLSSLPTLVNT